MSASANALRTSGMTLAASNFSPARDARSSERVSGGDKEIALWRNELDCAEYFAVAINARDPPPKERRWMTCRTLAVRSCMRIGSLVGPRKLSNQIGDGCWNERRSTAEMK